MCDMGSGPEMTASPAEAEPGPAVAAFSHTYAALPDRFFARQAPVRWPSPRLIKLNEALAGELGLDRAAIEAHGPAELFTGARPPAGALPIAMAYAGHQFGNFVPQLGDGRAILMGEVVDAQGRRRDIQWKGSGPTPFSRNGDGRAALGPALREYLISEAMHALGVPTTRALAVATTGERVYRDEALPGAVFTRVAASHIRVGTFQYFAARGDEEGLRQLADYVIDRHDPDLRGAANPYIALLERIVERQASLIARWMHIGFIPGVMNTDNMSVSGETIDFGPCAFMDAYDAGTVFSSIDRGGRYAYGQQPRIGQWNLTRLAEAMLPLIDADENRAVELATAAIVNYGDLFQGYWLKGMRAKLGLRTAQDEDQDLARAWLAAMQAGGADFTLTFRRLADAAESPEAEGALRAMFSDPAPLDAWLPRWRARLAGEPGEAAARAADMRRVNPAAIPRNHLVEAALEAAVRRSDFAPFHDMVAALAEPFAVALEGSVYTEPPPPDQRVYATFCGT